MKIDVEQKEVDNDSHHWHYYFYDEVECYFPYVLK